MKRKLFLLTITATLCIFCSKTMAFMESNAFIQSLETCTSYNPTSLGFDGTIVGVSNGKCHVKYNGTTLTNEETQEQIKINNCYFPISETKKIANTSRQISAFFAKYLGQSSLPEAEKTRMGSIVKEYFYVMKKYCR